MAALTTTSVQEFAIGGGLVIQKFSVTSGSSADASDEWVVTNLKKILAVLGTTPTGTTQIGSGVAGTAPVHATATVTFGSTDISESDTITVNGRVYTFNATPSGVNSIDIDATEATQATTFADAINRTVASGSGDYTSDTAINPDVKATRSSAVVTLIARVPGVGVSTANALTGNNMTLATIADSNQVSLSGSTFTGGLEAVVDRTGLVFVLNSQGTANAADSANGDLGVESSGTSSTFDVVVLGIRR